MSKQLLPAELTIQLDHKALGFADTSQLLGDDVAVWIGQEQARKAAQFGLSITQRNYNLFVLGEADSGRTSLMWKAMQEMARNLPVAPDLVFVHNFSNAAMPLAFHFRAGHGSEFSNRMAAMVQALRSGDAAAAIACLNSLETGLEVEEAGGFANWLQQLRLDVAETAGQLDAETALRYQVNLAISHKHAVGAPVVMDNDPTFNSLFGGIDYHLEQGALVTDFTRIRVGHIHRAHGGFLLLHLSDVLSDAQGWEKFRRFMRNARVQIEEPVAVLGRSGVTFTATTLQPQPVDVNVKVVLIGSREDYYQLQETDPDLMRHFKVKVDFAESFPANDITRQASSLFVAQSAKRLNLPCFSADAVARLLVDMQREAEDQNRQSALFGKLEGWLVECAAACRARGGDKVTSTDVEAATQARIARHSYPERELHRAIQEGEIMISVQGREIGQINALTQIDLGDYRFGSPVRISARAYPGDEGIIAIDREVEMTGPHHDKGVFILQSWLSATFSKVAPLCLNASLVFEQEYHGVEGDSASCAELYVLLSALSGLPLPQGIAITGALNQHGEVMAVGGVNEKIEGYFRVCKRIGLDGSQGVLIPAKNAGHLLLNREVVDAVANGQFKVLTFDDVQDGLEVLTGLAAGTADASGNFRPETALGRVQRALENFRKVMDSLGHSGRDKDHL
jgi:predicted ATP-dependent protease